MISRPCRVTFALAWWAAALSTGLLLSGCFTFTPRLNTMASTLEEELDGPTFDKEFGVKLGRVSTSIARGIAGWAIDPDDEEERAVLETLRGVRRVEVATYETHGDLMIEGPFDFERSLERRGWQTIARIRDDESFTWVVYREKKGRLTGFMVVALEDRELTLVDLRGRLDQTLAAAMRLARDNDALASLSPTPVPVENDPALAALPLGAPPSPLAAETQRVARAPVTERPGDGEPARSRSFAEAPDRRR